MAKAKTLNGKDLMLWIDGKVVALSTKCTLQVTMSTVDSATKDDGLWDRPEAGNLSWNANNESVDSADKERTNDWVYDQLFDKMVAGEPVTVTLGIPTNKNNEGVPEAGWTMPSGAYDGKALITGLDRDASKGSNGSVSVSLQGHGGLKRLNAAG